MALKRINLLSDVYRELEDEGFAEWLDNCFQRRNFYSHEDVKAVFHGQMTPLDKLKTVLPVFARVTKNASVMPNSTLESIKILKELYKESKISSSDLTWVNQTSLRVVVCMWQELLRQNYSSVVYTNTDENALSVDMILGCVFTPMLQASTSNTSPQNEREYRASLKKFFQLLELPRRVKLNWMINLRKNVEAGIHPFDKAFNWLSPKNNLQIDWALDYIQKVLNWHAPYPCFDGEEKLIIICYLFDSWTIDHSTKQLFLIKMRKAWSIKKFRDKNKSKKSFNFLLDTSMEKQLNDLASRTGLSKNKIIEQCVRDAHKNTPKPGRKKIVSTISNLEIPSDFWEP